MNYFTKKIIIRASVLLGVLTLFIGAPTKAHAVWNYYNGSVQYTVGGTSSAITVLISASPTSMTLPTNSTTITWSTSGNPDSCAVQNPTASWAGTKSPSGGSEQVNGLSAGTYTFDILCTKAGTPTATAFGSALVVVSDQAAPSGTLTAGSCAIGSGASNCATSVSWTTADLTAAPTAITRSVGTPTSFAPSPLAGGSQGVTLDFGSTTFYLYHNGVLLAQATGVASCISGTSWNGSFCADGNSGVSATLVANPNTITSGASSVLTWSSTNATSCAGTGFATGGAVSGSTSVAPTVTTTYTVSCTGALGTAIAQATVTVNSACGTHCPDVSLIAVPSTITLGASSTLIWSGSYVSSCTSSDFSTGPGDPITGSASVAPGSTTTYTINCTGAYGSASSSTTVTVVDKRRPIFREF